MRILPREGALQQSQGKSGAEPVAHIVAVDPVHALSPGFIKIGHACFYSQAYRLTGIVSGSLTLSFGVRSGTYHSTLRGWRDADVRLRSVCLTEEPMPVLALDEQYSVIGIVEASQLAGHRGLPSPFFCLRDAVLSC